MLADVHGDSTGSTDKTMTGEPKPTSAPKSASNPKKTFLLGVGCQKGGTSWLSEYLHSLPEFERGFTKEYHVLDVHFHPHNQRFKTRQIAYLNKRLERPQNQGNVGKAAKDHELGRRLHWVSFYNDLKSYFDYFAMLESRSPQVHVVGDITPAYALVPRRAYRRVKRAMTARGFDVKVVFLMRDPIERLHSATRMRRRDLHKFQNEQRHAYVHNLTDDELFLDMLASPANFARSDYKTTIKKLDAEFAPEEIFYAFYEDLFNDATVKRLTDFLGLQYQKPNFSERVNVTERTSELPDELITQAREELADVYDFVAERFPGQDFKELWLHA